MIQIQGVSFSYGQGERVLSDVNLNIAPGEFVCILGGNGSGKSTLAKHMNALLAPDEGAVRVAGLDAVDPEYVYDIRSRVGMVFQNPDDQLVATLVEDDVAFGPENLGVPAAQIAKRVSDALKKVGLVGLERRETNALSGGQKQRVAIAGVLAMEPRALVLDEASSMLDPRGRAGLMRVLARLKARGMAIVMITHYMDEAALADRVVVLDRGRVAMDGTPSDVLARVDELTGLNLEVPAACQLGIELHRRGVNVALRVRETDMVQQVAGICSVSADAGSLPAPATHDDEPAARPAVLEFRHVSYSYTASARERRRLKKARSKGAPAKSNDWGGDPREVYALRDVSLTVRYGEFLGLAGHTGSGKSTLVQHMNGLVHPLEGRVLLDGQDLADRKVSAAAKGRVGVVFQYPERQLFAATVADDVAFGPRNMGLSANEVERRVTSSLERVGLDPQRFGGKSPFELSGGQQRRVAFAGVLAMEPQVLVLDEPAAGLDPAARRDMLSLVKGLHAQGLTVVMVSHSMDDLALLCDRVVVMNEGAVYADGMPEQVFLRADELERVGLGLPAAQRMAHRLASAGVPLPLDRLYTIDTLAGALARLCGVTA